MTSKLKNIIYTFLYPTVKRAVKEELNLQFTDLAEYKILKDIIANHYSNGILNELNFDFEKLKSNTLEYVKSMKVGDEIGVYKYSSSTSKQNIYSSAYACMIFSLLGKIDEITIQEKQKWAQYFNSFQSSKDGLFYDESLRNNYYDNSDWWGARHLCLHLINAYIALDSKPKYPFYFLEKYYDITFLKVWLDEQNWLGKFTHSNDIDNKLMNIACALQYQRDYWQDKKAGQAINFMQTYLLDKLNPDTGMWGYFNTDDKDELSRMIQFTYHLLPIYFYDSFDILNAEKIIDYTLQTQNILGGFGVKLNSSACEDIDSIDILIRLSKLTTYKNREIEVALKKSFIWVLANQNDDGGFVFRRNEVFQYGHIEMISAPNESSMFASWFRTLSIAYMSKYLNLTNSFIIKQSPGYQF